MAITAARSEAKAAKVASDEEIKTQQAEKKGWIRGMLLFGWSIRSSTLFRRPVEAPGRDGGERSTFGTSKGVGLGSE